MKRTIAAGAGLALLGSAAWGQNAAQYAGDWVADAFSFNGDCVIELSSRAVFGELQADSSGCNSDMAFVDTWEATNSGVILYDGLDNTVAELEARRDGLYGSGPNGSALTLRRADGGATAQGGPSLFGQNGVFGGGASRQPQGPQGPQRGGGQSPSAAACITYADTGRCVSDAEAGPPEGVPVNAPGSVPRQVRAVVPLNVRETLALDSRVLWTVEQNACFEVDSCQLTASGLRCRIPGGQFDAGGYVSKQIANRSGQMTVTFTNRC